ncbi:MAG TPA: TIGR01777 family oxidoreductase [Terriglobales bacterium]|nr:TIGR01777 family oxidoreductase [Terriglobales bacterium]
MAKVLISGASGLIGSALARALADRGDAVTRLVRRRPARPNEVQWDALREVAPDVVSGFDAVVHLAGENIAERWTPEQKRRIRESRVVSTQNLVRAMLQAAKPPQSFICASATGYYGDRGEEILTEESRSGSGFLAEVCREWEAAAEPAAQVGIRIANLRLGIVLSVDGGALKQMLLPFRLGLGGRIGNARQWWSWIHIEDAVGTILHVLNQRVEIRGPVNVVSPNPVTNAEFTKALARALKRPALFRVPAFAARLAFGELAREGMLASARVVPKKLVESGFEFRYGELSAALKCLVK